VKPVTACALAVLGLAWCGTQAAAQTAAPTAEQSGAQAPARPASSAKRPAPSRDPGRPHSLELTASVLWFAPSSLGARNANLTSNNTAGTPYRWFAASGDFESAAGVEARLSWPLTHRLAIEGGFTFSRPGVSFTIANDVESPDSFTASGESMSQWFVDASLVAFLSQRGFAGGRLKPFVEAGGGFLRQLHGQDGVFSSYYSSDSGQVFHVGGGARYSLRRTKSGAVTGYGLRFDARYYIRNGGFSFDGGNTGTFVAGGGFVVSF
jgi:hypothetical protein